MSTPPDDPALPRVPVLLLVPSRPECEAIAPPGSAELVIARCGVGPVVAAAETARLLASGTYGRCVLAGLAGTRDAERAPLESLVIGTAVRDEACGVGHGATFRDLAQMGLAGPDHEPPDDAPSLLPLAIPASAAPEGTAWTTGVIGTVAATAADPAEAQARRARHADVLVEEMEGFAVALACRRAGGPLTIVRAVGNRCGDRDLSGWRFAEAFAALRAALGFLLDGEVGGPRP